jgi:nicotinate phosphoribosyltransferase
MIPRVTPLLTDLYQLTMLQSYWQHGMNDVAVFEFYARRLPPERNFLLAAGTEQAVEFLETLRFEADEIAWLRQTGRFDPGFLGWLAELRFTGDAAGMLEGTVFFAGEPMLRVAAPLCQAQLVESRIVNLLHFQTMVASKAARMALIRPDALLIDFGLRRAHGAEAGLFAARASYIAGFTGTATLLAEREFGIPAFGTMAHSYIQAHASEREAFAKFAETWPKDVVLLIDTYDTEEGARSVVALAPQLKRAGVALRAVRLDSGDLIALAHSVRRILDDGGLTDVRIFASSSVDEYFMQRATAAGAPIDGFGVGTHLTTSSDAPYLDCAYKLMEYAGTPRRKRSTGKATWPGRKQVFRRVGHDSRMAADTVTVEGDPQEGTALIVPLMRAGIRTGPEESLSAIRARAAGELAQLPEELRGIGAAKPYPVTVAPALKELARRADESI